ncbi:PAS domain-containing hybrid sensor histidine kinase/response regulator [Ahrensia kielensis]|uniref:histidine kinase n=1 Tax=Ahrensia kielensis TaxID=76980 RepID=A0ABU9T4B1_9HYPH
MQGWLIALAAFIYLAMLFAVAAYGDRQTSTQLSRPRPFVYAFSLAVYCTSWTFLGSVGVAADRGFEYFGIYVGPILLFTVGLPLVKRIVRLSKSERITSIADFLAARYGKNARVAALAVLIAIIGTVPYIALQLKAISDTVTLMVTHYNVSADSTILNFDVAFIVAITLIIFAILFGTRHADATEHQDGLMLAVALESIIKIVAFIFVAVAITFFLFDGSTAILEAFKSNAETQRAIIKGSSLSTWLVLTLLSAAAVIVLPRQFHVIVVENRSEDELNHAAWIFPIYLIAINALVMPVAIAGMLYVKGGTPADLYLLALPLQAGHDWLAMVAFIGGLSAATAMVIVATVALSIMISNNIIIPLLLWRFGGVLQTSGNNWSNVILNMRRISIAVVIFAAFAYYQQTTQSAPLAAIGLLSFAAMAQFVPSMLFGLYWRKANARGAFFGMLGGAIVWSYTLLIPALSSPTIAWIQSGPFGIAALQPQALFGVQLEPLTHGVLWSIGINILLVIIGSLSRASTPLERVQAATFVPRSQQASSELKRFTTTVTVDEVKETVARYVGIERMQRAFATYEDQEDKKLVGSNITDVNLVRYAEQILASAVGSSSARLVLGLLLEKDGISPDEKIRLLDDASEALQQNRDLLQIALDQMDQGITVFDKDYKLKNWNRQFRHLLNLPAKYGHFGMPLKDIAEALLDNGEVSTNLRDDFVSHISQASSAWLLPLAKSGRILELRSNPMPDGGLVVTYTDITGRVEANEALERSKQSLEQRVQTRTAELTSVNEALAKARQEAETANIGKTRFLAAAGHDISQPLNAARLYTASLVERTVDVEHRHHDIALKIDAALSSVETIIGAVLDISRLDAGALKATRAAFEMNPFLDQLRNDFLPLAKEKNLELIVLPSSTIVESDRALLMRVGQNLISNALKYTRKGKVLVGVRRYGSALKLCVYDTGIGIPEHKVDSVFNEFERLSEGALIARGLGLGLSIVDRISRVIGSDVEIRSAPGAGTAFMVSLTAASAASLPKTKKSPKQTTQANLLGGLNIACIDNEPSIVEGMSVLLDGWGASTICATNIAELSSKLDGAPHPPNAIIADYHLDNEDGISAIATVREKFGADLMAILITADRSNTIKALCADENISLLNKPLKPAALRALLHSIPREKPHEAAE